MVRDWFGVALLAALLALSSAHAEAQEDGTWDEDTTGEDTRSAAEIQEDRVRGQRAGIFIRHRVITDIGRDRGALHVGRFDFGGRFRTRTGHLGFDVGAGLGGGSYRVNRERTVSTIEMAFFLDARVYLNPRNRVQVFGLAGAAFLMGGPTTHDLPGVDESVECPALRQLEASFGLGSEVRLRYGAISFTARAVRREAPGDLGYYSLRRNVVPQSRSLWGMSVGVQLTGYFNAPPR